MIKSIRIFSLLVVSGLLMSCNTVSDSNDLDSDEFQKVLNGTYIFGSEVSSFQPCGSSAELWVTGEQKLLTKLESDYMNLVAKPYQEVFVSFKGNRLPKAKDGFAADYDGKFELLDVLDLDRTKKCSKF